MPSPFPGMAPYLEAPAIGPEFRHALTVCLSQTLNSTLPRPYYVLINRRILIEFPEEDAPRRTFGLDPIGRQSVEIRDTSAGHRLVTLVEILSPSNKRAGPDRDAYAREQSEMIEGETSLVEIDLLRDGRRVLPDPRLAQHIGERTPRPGYVVLVSTAWRRGGPGLGYRIYPFGLRDRLPCVGIPLKAEEPLVPLDLQDVFDRAYDGGPYRRGAVDYAAPPDPPLAGDDAAWSEAILRERGQP